VRSDKGFGGDATEGIDDSDSEGDIGATNEVSQGERDLGMVLSRSSGRAEAAKVKCSNMVGSECGYATSLWVKENSERASERSDCL
jgi:hypothetical protein